MQRKDFIAIAGLFVTVLLFFHQALFTASTFYFRDLYWNFYPLHYVVTRFLQEGYIPLWNPYLVCGQPLLALPHSSVFYPLRIVFFLFPFNQAFSLYIISHYYLAGLFMYLLTRQGFGLSSTASFISSVLYMYSGFAISSGNLLSLLTTVTWAPLWLLLVKKAIDRNRFSLAVLAGGVLGIQFLGDGLDLVLILCMALLGGHSLVETKNGWTSRIGTFLTIYILVFMVGLGIAAVQILPTLELISFSSRGEGLDLQSSTFYSVRPGHLIELLIPKFFGDPMSFFLDHFWGRFLFDNGFPYIISTYLGIFPLLSLLLVLFYQRTRLSYFYISLFILSILLALGRHFPLYAAVYHYVPLMNMFRYPVKFLFLATLVASILSGIGMDCLARISKEHARSACKFKGFWLALVGINLLALGVLAAMLGQPNHTQDLLLQQILLGKFPQNLEDWIFNHIRTQYLYTTFFIVAFSIIWFALFRRKLSWRLGQSLTILLILIDLFAAHLELIPVVSHDFYDHPPGVINLLPPDKDPYRIHWLDNLLRSGARLTVPTDSAHWRFAWMRSTLLPYTGIVYDLAYAYSQDPNQLYPRSQALFFDALEQAPLPTRIKLWKLLNIKYVLSAEPLQHPDLTLMGEISNQGNVPLKVYQNEGHLPIAYRVPQKVTLADSVQVLQALMEDHFDLRRTVLLEGGDGESDTSLLREDKNTIWERRANEEPKVVRATPNSIEVQTYSPEFGYLVLTDTYYPGWQMSVDGKAGKVFKANYLFKAAPLPAGPHTLLFEYKPFSFKLGLYISLGICTGLLGGSLFKRTPKAFRDIGRSYASVQE